MILWHSQISSLILSSDLLVEILITNESWYAPIILTHCYIRSIWFSPLENLENSIVTYLTLLIHSFFFSPPLFNLFQLFIYRFREKLIKICFRPFELSGINLDIHIDFEEKYFSQIRIYFLWNLSFLIYV